MRSVAPPTHGRDDFIARAPISADSVPDYDRWAALLAKWNARINLVAPSTLPDYWTRHALDSAQIVPLIPDDAMTVMDFGSGAGFPGLSIAIESKAQDTGRHVHLIESAGKKASFLRTVIRELGLPATVYSARIEAMDSLQADVITARAFAPLTRLLPLADQHMRPCGQLVLLKGGDVESELAAVAGEWSFTHRSTPSLSDGSGSVLQLSDLIRV